MPVHLHGQGMADLRAPRLPICGRPRSAWAANEWPPSSAYAVKKYNGISSMIAKIRHHWQTEWKNRKGKLGRGNGRVWWGSLCPAIVERQLYALGFERPTSPM